MQYAALDETSSSLVQRAMSKHTSQTVSLVIVIIGLFLMLLGAISRNLFWEWLGIDWSYFFSNVGIYITVVVAIQWYYDERTKYQLILEVTQSSLSNSNVVKSGINDFRENTTRIDYRPILETSQEVMIGFLYDTRLISDHIEELRQRGHRQKKTSILLVNPEGDVIDFLAKLVHTHDYIKLQINENLKNIREINRCLTGQARVNVRFHDSVLRYSFVYSREGVWIKMYRNSRGIATTPGIYIRKSSLLFDFYKKDIKQLWETSRTTGRRDG